MASWSESASTASFPAARGAGGALEAWQEMIPYNSRQPPFTYYHSSTVSITNLHRDMVIQ